MSVGIAKETAHELALVVSRIARGVCGPALFGGDASALLAVFDALQDQVSLSLEVVVSGGREERTQLLGDVSRILGPQRLRARRDDLPLEVRDALLGSLRRAGLGLEVVVVRELCCDLASLVRSCLSDELIDRSASA